MTLGLNKILEFLQPVSATEKMFFADRLRVMVKAGISIPVALETLANESKNKQFGRILNEVRKALESGEQFSGALEKYPRVFSGFFRNMIRVGEVSGTLEANLAELSNQMHKDNELTSKIRGAMTYPIVVLGAAVLIIVGIFTFVIPNIVSVFETLEAKLPLSTQLVITISKSLTSYGPLVAILFLAVIAVLVWFFKNKGQKIWHGLILNFLIIGPIAKKVNLARFARTLGALLSTDIPIIQGLEVTADVLGNVYYRQVALEAAGEIKKGVAASEILKKHPKLFPPLITTMIAVGEKSGATDQMLREVAEFFENDVDQITKNLSTIIEPLLILVLGLVIGGIAIAVISPIYTLTQQF